MQRLASRLALGLGFALGLILPVSLVFAGDLRLEQGELRADGRRVPIRGVGYSPLALGAAPWDPVAPCVYARDLPLISALGANTVRTRALLPEQDSTFVPLLGSVGLRWLAGFPLDRWYDKSRTLASRHEEVLESFLAYAGRFRGEQRLIGYVLGEQVAENYSAKFAGSVTDFYALLGDAAALLAEMEPEATPLVTTSTSSPAETSGSPPGLSFWLWNAGPRSSLAIPLDEIRRASAIPVLIGDYGVNAGGGQNAQAQAVSALTREISSSAFLLGGVYAAYQDDARAPLRLGLLEPAASEIAGLDSLFPRAVYFALTQEWEGRIPPAWHLNAPPSLSKLTHAATGEDVVAPGTLVRLAGEGLESNEFAANGIPWPLHMGQTCLCVGGRPIPLGMISAGEGTALVPWDTSTGDQDAILFRAGAATNRVTARVREYAPGVFPDAAVRAGTYCRVTADNGVRPGEILELYSTGLGPGAPSWMTPTVTVNGAPAEVLYSGTLPSFVGLNQVNLRLDALTPPGRNSFLQLRAGEAVAPAYPMTVVGPDDRFGVVLSAPQAEVVLQAGGPERVVELEADGRNGYCGPVLLASVEGPSGVTFRAPVGFTGERIPVEVRASAGATPQSGAHLVLQGQAPGAVGGAASLHLTVLAGVGDVQARVISGGFKPAPLARFDWNGRTLFSTTGGGAGRGISVLAIDAATGVFSPVQSYDTWGDDTASSRLVAYLNSLSPGTLALFAVADDGSLRLSAQAREVIAASFSSRSIESLGYQQSWALIGRKGAAAPIAEALSSESQVSFERTLTFPMH